VQAVLNLVRNPSLSPAGLVALARTAPVYQPALTVPPIAWILALLYTDTDLYASGRIAIDARGNIWSSNNWLPGTKNPSLYVTVLNPVGQPALARQNEDLFINWTNSRTGHRAGPSERIGPGS